MIVDKKGEAVEFNGKRYPIGALVYANEQSEYAGLFGHILEIRDGEDRETENETPDIYCEFEQPISPYDVCELEKRFSALYQESKTIDDIALDLVIMAPDDLTLVGNDDQDDRSTVSDITEVYIVEEDWADHGDEGSRREVFSELPAARMDFRRKLRQEAIEGLVYEWASSEYFVVDASEDSYEIYEDGNYCDNHYCISLRKEKLNKRRVV